jgi:sugar phosphate isomerase/epimerase
MQRRTFIMHAGAATAATLTRGRSRSVWAADAPLAIPDATLKRVGLCGVSLFREFAQTRPAYVPQSDPVVSLEQVPALCVKEFGLKQLELWSLHFEQATIAYCEHLRKIADDQGVKIYNVLQSSPGYNLSSRDPAERRRSINHIKHWMDMAAALGAGSLRPNTGGGKEPFDVQITGDSFAQLADYGKTIGVAILIENHGGYSNDPDNVVAIMRHMHSPWCGTIPDFGNMPAGYTLDERKTFLGRLYPYAHSIATKGMAFDEAGNHTTYDLEALIRHARDLGFKGIYSVENWGPRPIECDDYTAIRTILRVVLDNI